MKYSRDEVLEHAIAVLDYYAETSDGREEENAKLNMLALNMLQSIKNNAVTVEVNSGVAEVYNVPEGVIVRIIDND